MDGEEGCQALLPLVAHSHAIRSYGVMIALFAALASAIATASRASSVFAQSEISPAVPAMRGMVSTQEAVGTSIGLGILRRGGNAVDAAVAVGFALAVTLPSAGNLGGGGFMLVHRGDTGKTVAIDYRETAPAASTSGMFLDAEGNVDRRRARFSHHSIGVPGTVAGLLHALERYGTLPRAEVMAPAIALARDGIPVSRELATSMKRHRKSLARNQSAAAIFLRPDGSAPRTGEKLVQADLAWSLQQIAEYGAAAFYEGSIAERIVKDMRANGGPMIFADLKAYQVVEREPVRGTYRGLEIRSMPPPSSGGVHLVQLLNILENYPLGRLGHNSADTIHVMAEAMKLAFADRSQHLGDPEHWPVPVTGLTSKEYASMLHQRIDINRATPSKLIRPSNPLAYESNETTHFSVMDSAGNVVSNTYTLNFSYGSGIVAAGTGILLNNEMDDFSARPGVPNAYGLIGGEANSIGPGKRPLSSMTPVIVFKQGAPFLATGSLGGSHIITTTPQLIVNVIDHSMNVAAATAAARIHHQWLPDELRVEEGISEHTLDLLRARGHRIVVKDAMGSTQTVVRTPIRFEGASDPRSPGALTAGY